MSTIHSQVQKQYTQWVYPEPIDDLALWTKHYTQICDPLVHHAIVWPERAYDPKLSILVAGCGTSQAAILAYTNPQAKVVGIDVSPTSLEHAAKLKTKHNLTNLELREMDLHDAAGLDRRFDLIYATGVLHHLEYPQEGLKALAQTLADDGVFCLMLYAKYARRGVEMVQAALRRMGVQQTPEDVALTRSILSSLPLEHAVHPYIRGATRDLRSDSGIVDTFLHQHERSFTVPEIMELVKACELYFQGWTDNLDYYPEGTLGLDHPAFCTLASLPDEKQWAVTELLYQNTAHHSFLLRKQTDGKKIRINFNEDSFKDWIPARRYLLDVIAERNATILQRSRHSYRLSGLERDLFFAVDGSVSCGKLMSQHARNAAEGERGRRFFSLMWRLGHLTFNRVTT